MITSDTPHNLGYRYQLLGKLGQGAMGIVYRANDRLTNEIVALKRVLATSSTPSEEAGGSTYAALTLAQEFQTLASLRHPHIINVLDYGFDENRQPYFTMTLLNEASDIRQAAKPQTVEGKVELLIQILQALAYLHQRGIVHRDLKPGNVLVDRDNQVKVLDFGLAISRGQAAETVGSLAYMAPEVLQEKETTSRSDLYAVGIIAYEMFVGQHPFETENLNQMVLNILQQKPDLSPLPEHINGVIGRLLAKEPTQRYEHANTVIVELCQAIEKAIPQESQAIRESYLQAAKFVGRQTDLALLTEALQTAVSGQGSAWLIGGESGVGKSRLLDELRTHALVQGVTVLKGQGVEGGGLPYQLWREVIRPLLLFAPITNLEAGILKEIAPDIATLLGRAVPDAPKLDARANQQRLIQTIVDVFKRQPQPILIIMEDLQWMTESLEPIRRLVPLTQQRPLLIVANYRDDDRPTLPDELPGMRSLRLERLRDSEIAALSESMLGKIGTQTQILDLLKRETEGNAFFLVEVVRALAEDAGRLSDIGRISLPERVFAGGIQTIIRRRLERVPAWTQSLLKLTAVAGRQIDLRVLQNILKTQSIVFQKLGTLVDEWLTVCANASILEMQNRQWRFTHDQVRAVLLQDIPADEKALLHQKIAEAIENTYPHDVSYAAVLAEHWRAAHQPGKEMFYAWEAAEHAKQIGLYQEADLHFNRVLEMMPTLDDNRRAIILINLGENAEAQGDFGRARRELEEGLALATDSKVLQIQALNGLSVVARRQGQMEIAQEYGEAALQLARELDEPASLADCLTNLGVAFESRGAYESALLCYEESLAITQKLGDQSGTAENLNNLGGAGYYLGEYQKAKSYLLEALRIRWEVGNRRAVAISLNDLGLVAWMRGELNEAEWYYQESLTLSHEVGDRRAIALTLNNLGDVARGRGDYEQAKQYHEESLLLKREIGLRSGEANSLNDLGMVAYASGDWKVARDYHEQSLTIRRELNDRRGIATSMGNLGLVALADGDAPTAAHLLQEALLQATEIGATTVMLVILVGFAGLQSGQNAIRAVEWLSLVLNHSACHIDVRLVAEPMLLKLKDRLRPEVYETAVSQGKTLNLTEVVVDLLD